MVEGVCFCNFLVPNTKKKNQFQVFEESIMNAMQKRENIGLYAALLRAITL